jgi:signal peptidase II
LTTCITVVVLDQLAKGVVRRGLPLGETAPLLDGLLRLTHVANEGAAFGLMPGGRYLFIASTGLVLLAVGLFWYRYHPRSWWLSIAIGLVAGGALGNLIDRVLVGRVTDFLEFAFMDFPVFNVADTAIVTGVAIISVWLLFGAEDDAAGTVGEGPPHDRIDSETT